MPRSVACGGELLVGMKAGTNESKNSHFIDVEKSQLVCEDGLQAWRALPGFAAHLR